MLRWSLKDLQAITCGLDWTWKRVKRGSCPLLYFRLAYLSPSVAYYAGWWFIGASRSLTSDLWMKIRARVAWATRRTATREIDRHYYSRCLVNMSIMLRETSGTRKNVHSFDLSLSLVRVALCVCCNCSNQIPFFSLLFLLIFSYYWYRENQIRIRSVLRIATMSRGVICLKFNLL